jgi:hypothetical protein
MEEKRKNPDESEEYSASMMDPFPEPNTYPRGWNMDSILNPTQNKKPEAEPLPEWYEKFHEPRTLPPGWDFS